MAGVRTVHLVGHNGFREVDLTLLDLAISLKIDLNFPDWLEKLPNSLTASSEFLTTDEAEIVICATRFMQCGPQWIYGARGCSLLKRACTPCTLPDMLAAPSYVCPLNCEMGKFSRSMTSVATLAMLSPVVELVSYSPTNSSLGSRSSPTYLIHMHSCSIPAIS